MPRPLRLVRLLVVATLLMAACTSGSGTSQGGTSGNAGPGDGSPGEPGSPPILPRGPAGVDVLAELPGRLAIVDDTEVVLVDPTGVNVQIIDSADFVAQPTWAPTGTAIAWTRSEAGEAQVRIRPIETGVAGADDPTPGEGAIDLPGGPAVYLQWNAAADRLGLLESAPSETAAESVALSVVSVDEAGIGTPARVASGPSIYFSWSGEGDGMVVHRGDEVLVDPRSDDADPADALYRSDGWFSAPAWLDAESVLVVGDRALLRLDTGTGTASQLVEIAGPTEFVVNGPGSHVAFLQPGAALQTIQAPSPDRDPEPDPGPGALQVLDVKTGTSALVGLSDGTPVTALAWEWSPDGSIVSFLAPSELQPNLVRWYFWQLAPGGGHLIGATTAFAPTDLMRRSHLPFFAQYAQSATGWSPDGTGYAFAGTIDDVEGVFVHVLGRTPQSVYVGSGQYVTWSPRNVQAGGRSVL